MRNAVVCACCLTLLACAGEQDQQLQPKQALRTAPQDSSLSATPGAGVLLASAPVAKSEPPPDPAEELLEAEMGESKAAGKVIALLMNLRDSVHSSKYQGRTVIRADEGYYAWDCSGMANWILKRTAPRAYRALGKPRPVARDFFKKIEASPTTRSRKGWRKLKDVSEARPGDVFSWLRSPASKSKISGHVGFLVSKPVPLDSDPNLYVARIVDATSNPHGDDTRAREGDGGFGFGTLLFATDEEGKTIAYGWHGVKSLEWGFMPAYVNFGRVSR